MPRPVWDSVTNPETPYNPFQFMWGNQGQQPQQYQPGYSAQGYTKQTPSVGYFNQWKGLPNSFTQGYRDTVPRTLGELTNINPVRDYGTFNSPGDAWGFDNWMNAGSPQYGSSLTGYNQGMPSPTYGRNAPGYGQQGMGNGMGGLMQLLQTLMPMFQMMMGMVGGGMPGGMGGGVQAKYPYHNPVQQRTFRSLEDEIGPEPKNKDSLAWKAWNRDKKQGYATYL